MGQTKYYSLAFFDFGDQLDTRINVQKEIDRFVVIDKQLYGMYKTFGNGVIEGWTVRDNGFSDENGIAISISEGLGIIGYMAAQTDLPGYIYNLTPNSVLDIYATVVGETSITRYVDFFASSYGVDTSQAIRIARIGTGNNSITYVDNTVREEVGFEEAIQEAIDEHKHRGTPSKIDLETETKNQLSGARIGNVDASKITSGVFGIDRIPLIDHNDLENNGLLNHAALDSFVQTLSQNNKELLGEISTVNLLKLIIFHKYKNSLADEHFINELVLIPGISPDSFIDFRNSTANINTSQGCISGYPAQTGLFTSIFWNSTYAFNNYYLEQNMLIEDDTVSLTRSGTRDYQIADFREGLEGFEASTSVTDSNSRLTTVVQDGNQMARLGGGTVGVTYYYKKTFNPVQEWQGNYDELAVMVKTTEQIHSPVYMYILNGDTLEEAVAKPTNPWKLLDQDEYMAVLTEKKFDISTLEIDKAIQIIIYTDDDFVFDIDNIFVRRTNMVASSGIIRFRYTTEANVLFHSLFYDAVTPEDTSLSIRVKTSSSEDLLSRSSYSFPLNSGSVFSLSGTAIEIEVTMTSNLEMTLSPILSNIELRLLVSADFTGFLIDTEDEWSRGTLSNISVVDASQAGKSDLQVEEPINVSGRYFSKGNSVSEIGSLNIGFSGNLMPISPDQAYSWSITSNRGFTNVSSVSRLYNKNYLIADRGNNRVLEVDNTGALVKGLGSSYVVSDQLSPLTAVYNSTSKILSIAFTKSPVVKDITKIAFYVGNSKVALTSSDIVLANNKSAKKILEIDLDDDTSVRLTGATSDNLSINFESGAFTEEINISEGLQTTGNSVFSPIKGLVCFVGDFTFVDNIRHPVFVGLTSDDNWIIANSSVYYGEDSASTDNSSIPDLIEFDPSSPDDSENKISSTDIKFSDYSLGSVYEYEEGKFLIAGINETSTALQGISGEEIEDPFRSAAVEALKEYRGQILIIDKTTNRTQIFYNSPDGLYPSDIDGYSDGDYLVAESSFGTASGRLISLDPYGNVNWNYGTGTFHIINDAKIINDDNIIVSV